MPVAWPEPTTHPCEAPVTHDGGRLHVSLQPPGCREISDSGH